MVKTYLLKRQQVLLEKKIDLVNALHKNKLLLQENCEIVAFIKSLENSSYESFSPQNYKNDMNSHKLSRLKEEQIQLEEKQAELEENLKSVYAELEELDLIIQNVKQNENINSNQDGEQNKIEDEIYEEKTDIDSEEYSADKNSFIQQLNEITDQHLQELLIKLKCAGR